MAKEIRWSKEAQRVFDEVVLYLEKHWTEREVEKFVKSTDKVVRQIADNPKMFRTFSNDKFREVLITPHNLMMYKIYANHIEIITIYDTRQHPKKKLKK